ncbi:MAG: RdgB/HAM1 family non-canonical purine NTP pyrophosphatase [Candidatus Dadabacteria bacterium]|nr:MAG: RdgB/HAM1 family non-canonical purine NTP pyrophosphatase [Candidatus Dadabacteria bacterium]
MNRPERILMATRNPGKIREMRRLLEPLGVAVVSVDDVAETAGPPPEVSEDGASFTENALIKARAYAVWARLPVIAEDSGICVDALDGAPGIRSSRFGGVEGDDARNNALLLEKLAGIPEQRRGAHYHTSVVYLERGDAEPVICEAQWHGRILEAPRGTGGFGYDPLFWVPEHGCASAELSADQKNRLSHRGKAMRALVERLSALWD